MAEKPDTELIAVCEGRQDLYNMLAGLYFAPLSEEQIEVMAQTDYRAYGAGNSLMEAGFNDITRFLRKRHSGTRQMLSVDFTGCFDGTTSLKGKVAVPYASVFLSDSGLLNREPRNQALRAYAEEHLTVTNRAIPADHLSFELEFMGVLSQRIAAAAQAAEIETAQALVRQSQTFLRDHILSWFPPFEDLAARILQTRFYRGVLRVTEGFLQLDEQVLEELSDALEVRNTGTDAAVCRESVYA